MASAEQRLWADLRSGARRRLRAAIQLFGNLPRAEYRSIVADVVATLASQRLPDVEVYRKSLGAFPTLVEEALAAFSARNRRAPACEHPLTEPAPWEDDELDPVDAQWYFDLPSARYLISSFPPGTRSVVALGTPTVAALAAPEVPEVTLVDISRRFFGSRSPTWANMGRVIPVSHNLDEKPFEGVCDADVVVMDPPWYIENYRAWLHSAMAVAREGAVMAVTLPQLLTNRRALPEREEIIKLLEGIGPVTIKEDALTYITPSFELAVLETGGLDYLRRWRRADLAWVRVRRRSVPYEFPPFYDIEWSYRDVCGRAVRSWRETPRDGVPPIIEPADPACGYRLAGVGRNYLRSGSANLVTSRGRAAMVRRWGGLPRILDLLQAGHTPGSAVRSALPGVPAAERESLVTTLRTILER